MKSGIVETSPVHYIDRSGIAGSWWRVGNLLRIKPLRGEDFYEIETPCWAKSAKFIESFEWQNEIVFEMPGWVKTVELENHPIEWICPNHTVRARLTARGAMVGNDNTTHLLCIEKQNSSGTWDVMNCLAVSLPQNNQEPNEQQTKQIEKLNARIAKLEKLLIDKLVGEIL
jgi:hypothetical protein